MQGEKSLKALARQIISRHEQALDRGDERRPHAVDLNPVTQIGLGVVDFPPTLPSNERCVIPLDDGEPNLEMPCAARRGRVHSLGEMILHFCVQCGAYGPFGYGVNLRSHRLGRWYCSKHRPTRGAQ
ncbi:hypothetical protein JQ615_09770 [Bradyrhizobium jicamae]|uniref:Recombinase zinc beta ribbon domain-containing protein n=1 Tax=Bradyrhizobium jicamae TaxID=280332 RepID=A0ABS5FFX2_9BRAD|nr:hypothetical protein [Bradyrhizobium jicamae]MBR0795674.1 hypothetical protein [Bradyrhizobium jicamae]